MDANRIFFITAVTTERRPIFRDKTAANLLLATLADYRDEGKYLLHEFVIMPDRLHALITPARAVSLDKAVEFIRGGFSSRLKARGRVWQATSRSHRVRDRQDYERHREYIWLNPVWAQLAERAEAYPYASAAGRLRLDPVPEVLRKCA
jgi:putative transposase